MEYALISAAENGILDVVKWGIEQNANANAIDTFEDTALMTAAKFNHFPVVWYLVEHGAAVNVQNNDGDTLIQVAAKSKNREMVKLVDRIRFAPTA